MHVKFLKISSGTMTGKSQTNKAVWCPRHVGFILEMVPPV